MTCSACRHENPPDSTFCEECGARFERRCPSCGSVCTPTAKFCRSCGASLARPAETDRDAVADGRLLASIHFDLEDRSTAFDEAQARFLAGEAAPIGGQAPIFAA